MPKQGSKSGKSGKSSKTARVLNLLTDPDSIETSAESEAPQGTEGAKLADDRRTQAKIRGALEGALETELAEAAAPARPKRPKAPKSSIPGKSVKDFEFQPMQEGEDADGAENQAPEAAAPDTGAAGEPPMEEPVFPIREFGETPLENTLNELRAAGERKPDEYICFNVMQALVEDKAEKYIKMFGLCSCNRCHIDVVALALSNLPAKYVVAKPHELIPRLSIYEQKYSASIVTQVMSACRRVLDRPHHQREQG